ncbi:hypothetical protein [Buttiauxella sp. S04-F03]|uniref:hypothetical protein n=1 Tax=Buttiauxella sp. S04-F03 TaxID=2904525 RepID=UPI001E391BA6|nr:hypothetical protein [Buttiauxella sp. S04-F03]MCE0812953.1 hypothetical protein [Buttiauxella sp. S04-F03]
MQLIVYIHCLSGGIVAIVSAIHGGDAMEYVLWGVVALVGWLLLGYFWCVWFVDDEDDEYQECPYD